MNRWFPPWWNTTYKQKDVKRREAEIELRNIEEQLKISINFKYK